MADLLTDVQNYLVAQGLVDGDSGWTSALSYLPTDPDEVICIYDAPGPEPEAADVGSTEQEYDDLRFQIRGRSDRFGYAALKTKMKAIYKAIHKSNLSPNTGDPAYLLVRATQASPTPMGLDGNSRPEMVWNFAALRERE